MNGMHYDHNYAYNTGSDPYTISVHYELPPTSTIVQLTLSSYYEFDDQGNVQLGITHDEYLDSNGVTRHDDYNNVPEYPTAVSVNGMTRVDWEMTVSNCWADYMMNAFFWDSVN
jgi:hypothetical protein